MTRNRSFILCSVMILTSLPVWSATPADFVKTLRDGERELAASESYFGSYVCRHEAKSPPAQKSAQSRVKNTSLGVSRRGSDILLEMNSSIKVVDTKTKSSPRAKSCITDACFFTILAHDDSQLWSIAKFSRSDPRLAFDESLASRFVVAYPLRTFAATWTISDVLKSDNFTVNAVRSAPNGTLEGDYSVTVPRGNELLTLEGTCRIDPLQRGVVLENRYVLSATKLLYRTTLRRTTSNVGGQLVCNTLLSESTDTAKGSIEFTDLYTFEKYSTVRPDKAIFTLEHYGIPTPDDDLVPWYSQWKYWAMIALGGLVLAVLFRRLAVRRRVR
jgi:hypothetical protein